MHISENPRNTTEVPIQQRGLPIALSKAQDCYGFDKRFSHMD